MKLTDALIRIAALEQENLTLRRDNAELREENAELRLQVRQLTAQVDALTRKLEAVLAALDDDRATQTRAEIEAAKRRAKPRPAPAPPPKEPEAEPKEPRRDPHGRGALPEGLPRDEVRPPVSRCDQCRSTDLVALDTEVSEVYDLVRSHVRVRRIVRDVCRCKACHARVSAPLPPTPFPQAMCTAAMLAYVLVAKCSLHLPLERVRKELNRQGAALSDSTLGGWFAKGAEVVQPLVDALWAALLAEAVLLADATGLRVLEPGNKRRPAAKGEVLVWCTARIAVYHYVPSKHADRVEALLGDWTGTLVVDAESRFSPLFHDGRRVRAGCNAHARRKFTDVADAAPRPVEELKRFYAAIYAREREAREAGLTGDALRAHRQRTVRPLYDDLHAWLLAHREDFDPANAFRKAVQYTLNHWDALTRWVDDPRLPPDNNLSERLLKPVAMGRKAWLFAGSEAGAQRVCALLSLVETAKMHGAEPQDYLAWVLERLDRHPVEGVRPLRELMPWVFQREREQEQQLGGVSLLDQGEERVDVGEHLVAVSAGHRSGPP